MVVVKALTISLGLIILLLTLELIRRDLLRTAYALIWLLTGLVITVVGLSPVFFLNALMNIKGMNYQTAMLSVIFIFMLALLMQYSIIISRLSSRNKHLTQDVAILRQQVDDLLASSTDHADQPRPPQQAESQNGPQAAICRPEAETED